MNATYLILITGTVKIILFKIYTKFQKYLCYLLLLVHMAILYMFGMCKLALVYNFNNANNNFVTKCVSHSRRLLCNI